MHTICCSHFTPDCVIHDDGDKNTLYNYKITNIVINRMPQKNNNHTIPLSFFCYSLKYLLKDLSVHDAISDIDHKYINQFDNDLYWVSLLDEYNQYTLEWEKCNFHRICKDSIQVFFQEKIVPYIVYRWNTRIMSVFKEKRLPLEYGKEGNKIKNFLNTIFSESKEEPANILHGANSLAEITKNIQGLLKEFLQHIDLPKDSTEGIAIILRDAREIFHILLLIIERSSSNDNIYNSKGIFTKEYEQLRNTILNKKNFAQRLVEVRKDKDPNYLEQLKNELKIFQEPKALSLIAPSTYITAFSDPKLSSSDTEISSSIASEIPKDIDAIDTAAEQDNQNDNFNKKQKLNYNYYNDRNIRFLLEDYTNVHVVISHQKFGINDQDISIMDTINKWVSEKLEQLNVLHILILIVKCYNINEVTIITLQNKELLIISIPNHRSNCTIINNLISKFFKKINYILIDKEFNNNNNIIIIEYINVLIELLNHDSGEITSNHLKSIRDRLKEDPCKYFNTHQKIIAKNILHNKGLINSVILSKNFESVKNIDKNFFLCYFHGLKGKKLIDNILCTIKYNTETDLANICLRIIISDIIIYKNCTDFIVDKLQKETRATVVNKKLLCYSLLKTMLSDLNYIKKAFDPISNTVSLLQYYCNKYDYDDVVKYFDQIPESNECYSEAQFLKGKALLGTKDFDNAIGCFDKVPEDNEYYSEAQFLTGKVLLKTEHYAYAIECFNKVPKNNEYYSKAQFLAKIAIVKCFDQIPESNKYYSKFQFLKGKILSKIEYCAYATECFDKVPKDNEYYSEVQFLTGKVLLGTKDFDNAIGCFDKVPEDNEYYSEAQFLKGKALLGTKDFDNAIGCFDKVPEDNEYYSEAQFLKGKALLGTKDFDNAIGCFDKVPEDNEYYSEAQFWLITQSMGKKVNISWTKTVHYSIFNKDYPQIENDTELSGEPIILQ